MVSLTVLKASSAGCGTGHRCSHDDSRVAAELGLECVSVMLQDTEACCLHHRVLLARALRQAGDGLAHRSAGQRAGAGV